MKIFFSINKLVLTRDDDEIVTSYSKNLIECAFRCKNKWIDIYKYALFTDISNKQYIVDLGIGRYVSCVIPEDVLKGNYFTVSVFGDDRLTTTQETVLIKQSGFTDKTVESFEKEGSSATVIPSASFDGDIPYRPCSDRYWYSRINLFEIEEHPYY